MGIDISLMRQELTTISAAITEVRSPTVQILTLYTDNMSKLKARINKLNSHSPDAIDLKQRYNDLVGIIQNKAHQVPTASAVPSARKIKEKKIAELSNKINRLKLEILPDNKSGLSKAQKTKSSNMHVTIATPTQKKPPTPREVFQQFLDRFNDIDRQLQKVEQMPGQYFVTNALQELKDWAARKREDYEYLRDYGQQTKENINDLSGFIQLLERDTNNFIQNLPNLIQTEKKQLTEKQAELKMVRENLQTVGQLVTPKGIKLQEDKKFIVLNKRLDTMLKQIASVFASNGTKTSEAVPTIRQLTKEYNALVSELKDFEEGLEALEG